MKRLLGLGIRFRLKYKTFKTDIQLMLLWGEFQIRSRRVGPPSIDLFKSLTHNLGMKSNAVRTSIDLPRDLHRMPTVLS